MENLTIEYWDKQAAELNKVENACDIVDVRNSFQQTPLKHKNGKIYVCEKQLAKYTKQFTK